MTTLAANGNGTATANRPPKFQLPALDFKFGSLTEGTDIPPPLPSPIEEEPSDLLKNADNNSTSTRTTATDKTNDTTTTVATTTTNGTQTTPDAQRTGTKRPAESTGPVSPTSSTGPVSIRRLLSRSRLNGAYYANADRTVVEALAPRPTSQSNASIATDRTSKRTSGWFRRLRGSDGQESRRSSRIFFPDHSKSSAPAPAVEAAPTPTGPPPPKIPEFKALGSSDDAGSLGADLFKDIK